MSGRLSISLTRTRNGFRARSPVSDLHPVAGPGAQRHAGFRGPCKVRICLLRAGSNGLEHQGFDVLESALQSAEEGLHMGRGEMGVQGGEAGPFLDDNH